MDKPEKYKDVDNLLKKILSDATRVNFFPLEDLFEHRIMYLNISRTQALNILNIDHKTLSSILAGDSKKVDFVTLLKLSDFLEISPEELVNKYFQLVGSAHNESINISKKRSFIVNNFDLPGLKKIGFISNITNYEEIEERINTFFGYETIFEHQKHKINAVFSSGKRHTKKESLEFWWAAAKQSLEKTPNPYNYERDALVSFFPEIRWHSMNVERGLLTVSQALFKLGVTVIFVPKYHTDLHIKGATTLHRGKPCIILTKYTHYYATIWFTLLHELFHVLYDLEEIKKDKDQCHISGEIQSKEINEAEADDFARQYLFSDEKMAAIRPHIHEPQFVKYYSAQNHVHPSIVYSFYCWDTGEDQAWRRFSKNMIIPEYTGLLEKFKSSELEKFGSVQEVSKRRNAEIYNSI